MERKPIGLRKPARKTIDVNEAAAAAAFGESPPATPSDLNVPIPFRPGTVIMAERDKKDLQALDFKSDQALPGDFAERLAAHRAAQAEEMRDAIAKEAASGRKLKMPKTIEIKDLSPARQEDLRRSIEQATAEIGHYEAMREQQAALQALNPSVRAAAAAASPGVEVFRSNSPKAPPVASTPPPPPPPPTTAEQPSPSSPFGDGGVLAARYCPQCQHPVDKPIDVTPTKQDIIAFENSVCGDGGTPFLKAYQFFGGGVEVIFRGIPVLYADLVRRQQRLDRQAGRFLTGEEGGRAASNYLTLLSIHSIRTAAGNFMVADEVDNEIEKRSDDPTEDTPLVELFESFMATAPFSNESLWNTLRRAWERFDMLVQHLEAQASNASFWQATGA